MLILTTQGIFRNDNIFKHMKISGSICAFSYCLERTCEFLIIQYFVLLSRGKIFDLR